MKKRYSLFFVVSLFVFYSCTDKIPTDGLVAYYPFEENVKDQTKNAYHGESFGDPSFVDGTIGKAIQFESNLILESYQYLQLPNSIHTTEYTISFWVYFDKGIQEQSLIMLNNTNSWDKAEFWLFTGGMNKIATLQNKKDLRTKSYNVSFNYNTEYLNSPELNNKTSYLLSCTYKDSTLTLYLNDQEYANYQHVPPPASSDFKILVGVAPDPNHRKGDYNYPFAGYMDELRIYDRKLSISEIQKLYLSSSSF